MLECEQLIVDNLIKTSFYDNYHNFENSISASLHQPKTDIMRFFHSSVRNINLSLLVLIFVSALSNSQVYKLDNQTSFLKVEGTSSLHDWHVDAEEQSGSIEFSDLNNGQLKSIKFSVVSESLKSGKSSMDKNTYKALKTDKYKTIDFNFLNSTDVTKKGEGQFQVKGNGKLTVSGVSKEIPMSFDITLKNGAVLISGQNTILMTDYGIEPPKALLGTIKTGDKLTITYKSVFK